MPNKIYDVEREYTETVKEYYITPANFGGNKVFGKILKTTSGDRVYYGGDVSHYFLFAKGAPEYIGEDNSMLNSGH